GTDAARQILGLVQQTGERFGAAHIVDVLRGAETEKIVQCGHNKLPAHGTGSGRKKDEWRSLIRQLVAGGVLIHDVGGFGGLSLSADGRALLNGGKTFLVRQHARSSRKERATATTLSHEEGDLLAVLKRLRLSIAARRHVPAYLIFSDKTLQEMARQAPRDLDAFATISGVGTSKLRDFGKLFIDAIASHIEGSDALR
ncbi:MAG: RQC domain-containing protein, partial [Rhizomicrobium sp.]|nr:RQC domain-containing protein [Rhizomicrobium sp.]